MGGGGEGTGLRRTGGRGKAPGGGGRELHLPRHFLLHLGKTGLGFKEVVGQF